MSDSPIPVLSSDSPVISNRFRFPLPSRRFWFGVIAVLPALAIAGIIIRLLLTGGYIRPAGQVAEDRSHARTDEEELVKAFILNNADEDADKVKFLTWGPHLEKQEMLELAKEAGIIELADFFGPIGKNDLKKLEAFKSIIRVRYRKKEFNGFAFIGNSIGGFGGNQIRPNPNQTEQIKTHDDLFMVYGKLVVPLPFFGGGGGDNWKLKFRKELSKHFPALKP